MNNTVMITECLNDFISENEITLSQSDAFELYTLYLLNKKSNLSAEDLMSAVVDGSSDGGIDTFLLMVDEYVINSDEELEAITVKSDSTIKVVIGQSKFNNKFSEDVVNKFFISMDSVWNLEIQNDDLIDTFNEQLVERIIWFREIWKKAIIKGAKINIQFYYGCISNEIHESDTFKAKKEKIIEQAKTQVHQAIVGFDLYSAEELLVLRKNASLLNDT
jgi:hypothetical protein